MVLASPVAIQNDFDRRYALNPNIVKNKYHCYAVDYDPEHRDLVPVGRGVVGSEHCAEWKSLVACKNFEGHKGVILKTFRSDVGVDCTDKVVIKHQRFFCHSPSCPICFDNGFAARNARAVEHRVNKGVEAGMGKPEHVTISVAIADRVLPFPVFKKRAESAARDRGIYDYCMVPHMYRINRDRKVLEYSPHFHLVCFIEGGFDECRGCVHGGGDCASCDGFKGREVRGYARDGYLVKVHEIRKSVFGTAKYVLNHASIRVGFSARGSHVVTWHGRLSNRKFKSGRPQSGVLCPACNKLMERVAHAGSRRIIRDFCHPEYVPYFVDDEFDERGLPNYPEIGGGCGG
jgi:hypothetical protein